MILIEITHPAGALAATDQTQLAETIVSGLIWDGSGSSSEVPEETLRRMRTMTHLGFRELAGWTTGDGPWRTSPPPLWVTVTVPEAWRAELSRHVIGWIRRAVRDLDERRGWRRAPGALWINLVGVADGSIGLGGKPASADDVLEHMTEEFWANHDHGRPVPEGKVVDPMCGMLVRLGPRAITLDRDGEILGFCADSCRDAYARRMAGARR